MGVFHTSRLDPIVIAMVTYADLTNVAVKNFTVVHWNVRIRVYVRGFMVGTASIAIESCATMDERSN